MMKIKKDVAFYRSYKIKCLEPYLDTHFLPVSQHKITKMIECITMNLAQCRDS